MKRIWHRVGRSGINILALVAAVGMVVLVIQSHQPPDPLPVGEERANPLPWLPDLLMAYLGAWIFNLLVVELPAKRKTASRFLTLKMPLEAVAHNGMDMIRDLERIAGCPPRRITVEHLTKVLTAVNDNEHIRSTIAYRLKHSADAYKEISPYAADLPLELQESLQREAQNSLRLWFSEDHGIRPQDSSLTDLRAIVPQDLFSGGKFVYKRVTLAGYARPFMDYYRATEAVRVELAKHQAKTRTPLEDDGTKPGRILFFRGNPLERNWTYPPEATSELLPRRDTTPRFPPCRVVSQ